MKRVIVALVVLILAVGISAPALADHKDGHGAGGGGSLPFASVPKNTIYIRNMKWYAGSNSLAAGSPVELISAITADSCTAITWINLEENKSHNVEVKRTGVNAEYSGLLRSGQAWIYELTGIEYEFYCDIHRSMAHIKFDNNLSCPR